MEEKHRQLVNWNEAPSALASHPPRQEEHLIPLHVIAGAAGNSKCKFLGTAESGSSDTGIVMANIEWQ